MATPAWPIPQSSGMIAAPDSYYSYVKARIQAVNSARLFGGISQANDWPPNKATTDALYLLLLNTQPIAGIHNFSGPFYMYSAQWIWLTIGTDIQPGTVGNNRGDRYRIEQEIMQELIYGSFPGFAEKLSYTLANVGGNPVLTGTSFSPQENIWWGLPKFAPKPDKRSGVLYSAASVDIYTITPAILS